MLALLRRRPLAAALVVAALAAAAWIAWSLLAAGGTHFDPEMR